MPARNTLLWSGTECSPKVSSRTVGVQVDRLAMMLGEPVVQDRSKLGGKRHAPEKGQKAQREVLTTCDTLILPNLLRFTDEEILEHFAGVDAIWGGPGFLGKSSQSFASPS